MGQRPQVRDKPRPCRNNRPGPQCWAGRLHPRRRSRSVGSYLRPCISPSAPGDRRDYHRTRSCRE
ncbi:FAD binding domain protein [Alternaria alternata]|nr:FAD binding domain protein [Alternaria alternata]